MKVSILGTEYGIEYRKSAEIEKLTSKSAEECQSCYDFGKKLIYIAKGGEEYTKTNLRDAIIHVFAAEAGLDKFSARWMATQFPKILKPLKRLGLLKSARAREN